MDRTPNFASGAINARTHPEFFRPPKGAPRPTASLGDLENAQIVRLPKQEVKKPQKSKVIKPGTIL